MQPVCIDQAILLQTRRIPIGTSNRVDMNHVHGIDLLERTALGLDHEEVDDEEEDEAGDTEDETVEVVDVVGDQSGEERDEEVEEPVRGGGEGHAGRTVTGGIEFANNGPD